mgnify:CR=1 FL=1
MLIIILLFSFTTVLAAKQLKVHYIDVGQGDSILIEAPNNQTMLIDGGPKERGSNLRFYINSNSINELDYVVSTHPHADHIGGLLTILEDFEVGKVIDSGKVHTSKTYEDYLTMIDRKGIPYEVGRTGDKLKLGDVSIKILHPDNTDYDLNNTSVVMHIKYGKARFLFMGDVEEEAEDEILENNKSVYAQFLKVGHHGSGTSTSTEFLKKVKPQVAVIMCGEDNNYGHPHESTVNKLKGNEINVYRTDKNGTIVIKTDGESYSIDKQFESKITGENYQEKTKDEDKPNSNNKDKFVGSIESDKYHNPGCRWAEKIKPENEIWFDSVEEAKAEGYKPCGTCSPPS